MEKQVVLLNSARGQIERVVITDNGKMVAVCRPEELDASRRENRAPHVSWFRKSDFVDSRHAGNPAGATR